MKNVGTMILGKGENPDKIAKNFDITHHKCLAANIETRTPDPTIILFTTLNSRGRAFTSSENRTNHSCFYNVA